MGRLITIQKYFLVLLFPKYNLNRKILIKTQAKLGRYGEPAISLHSYTVPLVQWSSHLLPVMRDPGSIPRRVLM
jgi:hypothetical protein